MAWSSCWRTRSATRDGSSIGCVPRVSLTVSPLVTSVDGQAQDAAGGHAEQQGQRADDSHVQSHRVVVETAAELAPALLVVEDGGRGNCHGGTGDGWHTLYVRAVDFTTACHCCRVTRIPTAASRLLT